MLKNKKLMMLAGCSVFFMPFVAQAQQGNLAAGKAVEFSRNPNYALCTDPDDKLQLTDGKFSSLGELQNVQNTNSIWVQKGTVGWSNTNPLIITVDLGSVQPISGVMYSTAAGRAGVTWPDSVYIAVSDDQKEWKVQGDLVALSRRNGTPPAEGYAPFRYQTRDLKTRGRYVAFSVVCTPYTFVDEIEVYAGDKALLNAPVGGESVSDLKAYTLQNMSAVGARRRLANDAQAIAQSVQASALPQDRRNQLATRLKELVEKGEEIRTAPSDFKAIVPLNATHREMFAIYAQTLAAQGVKPLTVWKQHRFAWQPLLAKPTTSQKNELSFSMLGNQFRSDALLLTNASTQPKTVQLKLNNPPRNAQTGWLQIDAVEFTDTKDGNVVASALLPVEAQNGSYAVTIPAGLTRKVWFTVDSSKVSAGNSQSVLEVVDGNTVERVPVSVSVANIAMKAPRISLGMWDYTNGNGIYGINPKNRDAAIKLMRSHYVDTPWASSVALPRPGAAEFDAQNNLKSKLDFRHLDEWIARWPGARRYFIYAAVGDSFGGVKMDAPEFAPRVGSWAKAVSAHVRELGLKPQQLGILLVDEPHKDEQDAIIAAWAKAINASAPELTLFQDPTWKRPDQTKIQEAITEIDILCPMLPLYYKAGEPVKSYYANLKKNGKELWFYQCTGPTRTYDPQTYFRHQAWHTYSIGGTGQGFWSFGDVGSAPSSWNEYAAGNTSYAPALLGTDTVHNSIHWDSVREGMQDYEELAMLQDAINSSKNVDLKTQAQKVLDDAVKAVVGSWDESPETYSWQSGKVDPNIADEHLDKVRKMLVRL
jgi:hypothetical protein